MSESTTAKERAWLSRNWFPTKTFRTWVADSDTAHKLVPRLIDDVNRLKIEKAKVITLLREAGVVLKGMMDVINESKGIDGWHLNGDTAEWGEFDFVGDSATVLSKITVADCGYSKLGDQ